MCPIESPDDFILEKFEKDFHLIYETMIESGTLKVHDTPIGRLLSLNDTYQGMHIDKDFYSGGFPYTKYFNIPLLSLDNPKNILILGLGVGSCPIEFIDIFNINKETITIVEKYPEVLHIAVKYFDFPYQDRVIIQDGQDFLATNQTLYDLIILDIYEEKPIHPLVIQKHFIKLLHKTLTPTGLLAVNMLGTYSEAPELDHVYKVYKNIFSDSYLIPCKYGAYLFYRKLLGLKYELDETVNMLGLFGQSHFIFNKNLLLKRANLTKNLDMIHYIQDI